ncbi:MAG: PorP/SprF family type IX secretion system membrane protein [Chitinophagaceae bacterium]
MKRYLLALAATTIIGGAQAQQLQNSSMSDLQGTFFNPSMAGVEKDNFIGFSYRTQWSGISGSPKTATAFGSFKLPSIKMGISGYIYNDKTGPTSRTGLQLGFAKHIIFANNSNLSLGIETRFMQFSIDKGKLGQTLGNDPVLGGASNNTKFDAGFGMSYTNDKWQVGASVSQLTQSKLNFYSGNLTRTEQAKLYRHYFVHGKYLIDIDGSTTITPNFLLTMLPNAPTEFQAGARIEHMKLVWFGAGYRVHQGPMFSAGINLMNKFSIGYAFDVYNAPLSTFTNGNSANEFLIKYSFSKK